MRTAEYKADGGEQYKTILHRGKAGERYRCAVSVGIAVFRHIIYLKRLPTDAGRRYVVVIASEQNNTPRDAPIDSSVYLFHQKSVFDRLGNNCTDAAKCGREEKEIIYPNIGKARAVAASSELLECRPCYDGYIQQYKQDGHFRLFSVSFFLVAILFCSIYCSVKSKVLVLCGHKNRMQVTCNRGCKR